MSDLQRAVLLIEEAEELAASSEAAALARLDEGAALAEAAGAQDLLARAYELLGRVALLDGEEETAGQVLPVARQLYGQVRDPVGGARVAAMERFLADPRPFRSDLEALEEEIDLVGQVVTRMAGPPPGPPPGEWVARRTLLDLRRGRPVPGLDRLPGTGQLERLFGLRPRETAAVLCAAAPACSPALRRAFREAQGDGQVPAAWMVRAVLDLCFGGPAPLDALGPGAAPAARGLVRALPHPWSPAEGDALIEVEPAVLAFLRGRPESSAALRGLATLRAPDPTPVAPPDPLQARLQALAALLGGGPEEPAEEAEARPAVDRVLVAGPAGAGKKELVAQLANHCGRALLVLQAAPLLREPERLRRLLTLAERDALLQGAFLLVDLGDEPSSPPLRDGLDALVHVHFVATRASAGLALLATPGSVTLRLEPLPERLQLLHFQRALRRAGAPALGEGELLALCREGLTPGAIERAVLYAASLGRLAAPARLTVRDLQQVLDGSRG